MKINEFNKMIGDSIKKYMKEAGYTQLEFSRVLNVSEPTINRWLNGKSTIDLFSFHQICQLLNKDSNTLLGIANPPQLTQDEITELKNLLKKDRG